MLKPKKLKEFTVFITDPSGFKDRGIFCFFEDVEELKDILIDMNTNFGGYSKSAQEDIALRVNYFCSSIKIHDLHTTMTQKICEIVKNSFGVDYVGKTENLATSDEVFCEALRGDFRKRNDRDEEEGHEGPIDPSEAEDFYKFIISYKPW